MTIVMRRAVAAVLTAHAIAHLAGFAWPWWMLEPLPSPPDEVALISDAAMRVSSVLWLAAAILFAVAAFEVLRDGRWWRQIIAGAATASLVLSIACWPGSLLGVPINVAILLTLYHTRRSGRRRGRSTLGVA
jgi:hypothetical protein